MFKLFIGGQLAQEAEIMSSLTLAKNQELRDKSFYHSWEIKKNDKLVTVIKTENTNVVNNEIFTYNYYDGRKNNQIKIANGLAEIKFPIRTYPANSRL